MKKQIYLCLTAFVLLCFVSCIKEHAKEKEITAQGVSLDPQVLSLSKGEYHQLKATIEPEDTSDKRLIWTIDDNSIADIDETGGITALKVGEAIISVATENEKTCTCKISVTAKIIEVSLVEISESVLNLKPGTSKKLVAVTVPSNASDAKILWESSNKSIATGDNGEVTAISLGKANITASTSNGKTANCQVVVSQPVESISIESKLEIQKGKTAKITANILPVDSQYSRLIWTSSKEEVARVDSNGKVEALRVGYTDISVKVEGTDKLATCVVQVMPTGTVLFDLVGSWSAKYCTTIWGDREFSEEELFDYSGGNPKIEEKFAMHKKMYKFTIHEDDKVSLDFIARNQDQMVHLEGNLKVKEGVEKVYTGSFPTEEKDAKSIDFQYVYNKYMHSYEVMISIPSECCPGTSEERIYFQAAVN